MRLAAMVNFELVKVACPEKQEMACHDQPRVSKGLQRREDKETHKRDIEGIRRLGQ